MFRSLFRGREDIYARRLENPDGRHGYSPAALKDRKAINASRPEDRKKIDQVTRKFLPLTDGVIESHLLGKETVGIYKAQAMRLQTYAKPRVIACGQDFLKHFAVPRGCLIDVLALLRAHHIEPVVRDERFPGAPIEAEFNGQLRPAQEDAAKEIVAHDEGILCAPTAFGKTAVAAWLIAARKVNTLVLVHRQQLLDQWQRG